MTLKVKKWVMAQFLEIPKIAGILLLLISHETTHPYKDGQPHAVVLSCSLRWLTFCLWSIFPPWRNRLSLHYALLLNSFLCESKNLYLVAVPGVWTRSGMWPSSRAPPLFPAALDKSHCSSETVRMPHFSLQVTAKQPPNPFLQPHQSLAINAHFSSSEGFCLCFSSRPQGSLLALFSLYASFYLSYFPP